MTCIAWDGRALAADKRSCAGSKASTVTKIGHLPDGSLYGMAGDFAVGRQTIAWIIAGAEPSNFPEKQKSKDDFCGILVIRPDKSVWKYEDTAVPFCLEDPFMAIGSGRDYALAAMHLGKSAFGAVEIAALFDPGCGNGIDVLTHEC